MTTVEDNQLLTTRQDGTLWYRWYDRDDGGWQDARAVYFEDEQMVSALPHVLIEDTETPVHRTSGTPIVGCRWATPDDVDQHEVNYPEPVLPLDPPVLLGDLVPEFLAVSCSTERVRVLLDVGHRATPTAPVDVVTISVDLPAAVEMFRNLSGALRYLGVNTDTLFPGNVTMTDRR
jgi:hypothetical protein